MKGLAERRGTEGIRGEVDYSGSRFDSDWRASGIGWDATEKDFAEVQARDE